MYKNELKFLLKDLNKKLWSIKFDYKYSTDKIEFLDSLVYLDQHQKLQTTLYQEPTDSQNYLQITYKY